MTCTQTMTLGVYLLGALEPNERSAFEAHLAGCDVCRAELVRLAPLPGLLHQISPEDFADEMPDIAPPTAPFAVPPLPPEPPSLTVASPLPPVMEPVVRAPDTPGRARRYRLIAAAAAVVVVLMVGAVFGWQAIRHEDPPAAQPGVTWSATEPSTGVRADATLVDREWGTEIQAKIDGTPSGKKCYLIVYDHYGKSEVTGWWWTDHDPNEKIPASTSIRRSKIEKIVFKLEDEDGNRTVAVTIPEQHEK